MNGPRHVIGVDVGTGSARAAIFEPTGRMLAAAKHDITLFHASGSIVEQSSAEIWNAVCQAVKGALSQAAVSPDQVAGIGFDATCSLSCWEWAGNPCRSARPNTPSETSSSGWITVPYCRRSASTPRTTRCSSMSAAGSRRKWKRRSCCGCSRTSLKSSPRRGSSSTSPTF